MIRTRFLSLHTEPISVLRSHPLLFKIARNWSPRWTTRTVFALGCVGTTVYLLWMAFGPPPGMPISKETTHFTGPIDQETGLLDTYTALLRAKGWPEEPDQHEWHRLIAPAAQSDHALKYYPPDAVQQPGDLKRYRSRLVQPFNEDDDPEYAAAIDANEPWYRAVLDSEPPIESTAWVHLLGKAPSHSFRYRAMLAFGRGDHAKGVESLRYLSRLAEANRRWGYGESAVLACSVITKDCWETVPTTLFSLEQVPDQLRELALELGEPGNLPQVAARVIDEGERYHHLNYLSSSIHYTVSVERMLNGPSLDSQTAARINWFLHRVDWRRFAKKYHKFVDGLVERVAIDDDRERTKAIEDYRDQYLQQFEEGQPDLADWADVVTRDVTRIAEKEIGDMLWFIEGQLNFDRRVRQQIRLAVYLAEFRNEHKRFPNSLEELVPDIPLEHRYVVRNNLTNELWDYAPQADGMGFTLKQRGKRWIDLQWPPKRVPASW